MTAGRYDTVIEQGTTWTRTLFVQDDQGAAVDLTGYSARMQLRASAQSVEVAVDLTTVNGRITLDPALGKLTLKLTPAETAALAVGTLVYDLEIESGTGDVTRVIEGKMTVKAEVTR